MNIRLAIAIVVLILILYAALSQATNLMLFYPTKKRIWTPTMKYEEINLNGISIWYFSSFAPSSTSLSSTSLSSPSTHLSSSESCNSEEPKTILFCHANAGNNSHREYIVSLCEKIKVNLVLFDYSGYGDSSGVPSQSQILEDGRNVYEWLAERVNPKSIIVWGESIGGSVAIEIAHRYECHSLILMCTFSSLTDILLDSGVNKKMAWLFDALFDTLQSKKVIDKIQCPIAILHSTEDNLIPYKSAERLYSLISHDKKKLIPIRGSHSLPELRKESIDKLTRFIGINSCSADDIKVTMRQVKRIVETLEYR